jgi:hypothetical protein
LHLPGMTRVMSWPSVMPTACSTCIFLSILEFLPVDGLDSVEVCSVFRYLDFGFI